MKIYNIENNKEVVYVQLDDLAFLMHSDEVIPAVIVTQVFGNGVVIINENNNSEFVRFDDPVAVKYFKDTDWIINFKDYYKLSEEDLFSHGQAIQDEMNEIADKFNSFSQEERKKHMNLRNKHELLKHKFSAIPKILWFKQGFISIPLPEVGDSDGFMIEPDDNSDYIIKQGLNPMQTILYRRDGKDLTDTENIPTSLLQSSLSLLIMNNTECNEFFGDFEQTSKISKDKKALITSVKIKPREVLQEEKEENKVQKLTFSKKVKQFLNNLLKG